MSKVATAVLTSGGPFEPSTLFLFSVADRSVSRILRDTFVGDDSRRLSSHSFPGRSCPKERRKERGGVGQEEGKRKARGRSHPREQQPADWPFYRADRSRLYEESHNGNLRFSLALLSFFVGLRGLFSFASCVFSLLYLSSSLENLANLSSHFVSSLPYLVPFSKNIFNQVTIGKILRRGNGKN